mmetsp:Transcript_16306/g.33109  ORF Transcript_16306/g.33109 Transcript_16306/m.33109 type:complete len:85 (+) Transcript_16306:1364-1618(+)
MPDADLTDEREEKGREKKRGKQNTHAGRETEKTKERDRNTHADEAKSQFHKSQGDHWRRKRKLREREAKKIPSPDQSTDSLSFQ